MGLFKKNKKLSYAATTDSTALAQRALDFISEGVMVVDESGMIQFANPAIAAMSGYDAPENITGLDYTLVIRLSTQEMAPVEPNQSELYTAIHKNEALQTKDYMIFSAQTEKNLAVAINVIPTGGMHDFRIVTFRDITVELAEENEQAEFISTASHEMRTPVASIEGYLGLALNPQTATIDERAKQYLDAAHAASKHLGNLFKDLLDVTKLDDKRLKAHLVPVDAVELVKRLASEREGEMAAKKIKYSFGTATPTILDKKRIEQKVYMAVDLDFMHEIMDNLIGNAIKYTPEGGEIWVNARGDGDKVLINVTDTGIGISAEDAGHVFQKFYRVDNSQTRQIGGTGLGLYLVKQRVESLGGRVWLESSFGEGSTFFVSLPRISDSEYEKMMIAHNNEQMVRNFSAPAMGTVGDVAAATGAVLGAGQVAITGEAANLQQLAAMQAVNGGSMALAPAAAPMAATVPVAPAAVPINPSMTSSNITPEASPAAVPSVTAPIVTPAAAPMAATAATVAPAMAPITATTAPDNIQTVTAATAPTTVPVMAAPAAIPVTTPAIDPALVLAPQIAVAPTAQPNIAPQTTAAPPNLASQATIAPANPAPPNTAAQNVTPPADIINPNPGA